MKLNKYQFSILNFLESHQGTRITQQVISENAGFSLGKVNLEFKNLLDNNQITLKGDKQYFVTENGYDSLRPYEVKKAIILAAGFGSRLAPVTLDTPKPLVFVNGIRIIDTIIDSLIKVGITNITIVRGYKKEQFNALLNKYPFIKFIDNNEYNISNNISSLYCVRNELNENCYLCDADLIVKNQDVISKYQYSSNYLGIFKKVTNDWCLSLKNGYATKMVVGGRNVYLMVGISYWTSEDILKIKKYLEEVYNTPGGKENYWDNIALVIYKDKFKISIRECYEEDIVEIDNFNELVNIDPKYLNYRHN